MKFITKLSIGAAAILAAISMWSFASAANLATNLTWCTTNSGTINVSYQECNSLAYLFDETSGMNRTHNDNWLSNTDLTTRVTP